MAVTDPEHRPLSRVPGGVTPGDAAKSRPDAGAVHDVCPFLASADGRWRSAYPSREHRCTAVGADALLALARQRTLCLGPGHRTCSAFVAARGTWSLAASDPVPEDRGLWPSVRTVPLLLEPTRGRFASIPIGGGRAGSQALLVAMMALALVVLVVARATAPPVGAGASPSPGPTAIGSAPVIGPPPSAQPSPAPTSMASAPAPTASPSAAVTASPTPESSPSRTYRVQAGDTLYVIAQRFGTTVKAIAEANGISDPTKIRIGQVLAIP
jgi:LysM repeat protein